MTEPVSTINLAVKLLGFVVKPLQWLGRRSHLLYFRLRYRKPPMSQARAKLIAHSILAGNIISAIPYRNINSKRIFIAALRANRIGGDERKAFILEQMGKTFVKVWESPELEGANDEDPKFEVIDIDRDGIKEIAYIDYCYGCAISSQTLSVYSTEKKQLFKISETFYPSDGADPLTPETIIEGECAEDYKRKLEAFAVKHGFFEECIVADFEKPEFAMQRWHMENGNLRNGNVNLHFYDGDTPVDYGSYEELDTGKIRWRAYFKGPLTGYIKDQDKCFIAFSPDNRYNWVSSFVYLDGSLWFGLMNETGLLRLNLNKEYLEHFLAYDNKPLPSIRSVEIKQDAFVINEAFQDWQGKDEVLSIPLNNLDRLQIYSPFLLEESNDNCQVLEQ